MLGCSTKLRSVASRHSTSFRMRAQTLSALRLTLLDTVLLYSNGFRPQKAPHSFITILLKDVCDADIARVYDASGLHDMHEIWFNEIQEPLVMRDHDGRAVRRSQTIDCLCHIPQCIDVQPCRVTSCMRRGTARRTAGRPQFVRSEAQWWPPISSADLNRFRREWQHLLQGPPAAGSHCASSRRPKTPH